MTNQSRKCANCMWWDADGPALGTCKALPPSLSYDGYLGHVQTKWPQTKPRDWCGSFRMKEPEQ